MDYKTNWKDFLKYEPATKDPNGPRRRVHDFPVYVVDTAPGEKNYMYHGEYEAMIAAEKAAKNARRAAREAELAASRPQPNEAPNRAAICAGRRGDPPASGLRASLPRVSSPPDYERHSRKCLICSHPDRDAIEGEFIRWRSPEKIARDYDVTDRNSIYRHAHATNLFEERRRHIPRVLESYLETIDDNPPEDFDPVTRAVRVYAHLNTTGGWFEPLRRVHITTSHVPYPSPELDDPEPDDHEPEPVSDPDPEPDPHPDPQPEMDRVSDDSPVVSRRSLQDRHPESDHREPRDLSVSPSAAAPDSAAVPPIVATVTQAPRATHTLADFQVPAGTAEGSPARKCWEGVAEGKSAASAALTSGASRSFGTRAALSARASKYAVRAFTGRGSRSLGSLSGFGFSRHSPLPRLRDSRQCFQAPNRDNSKSNFFAITSKQTTSQNLIATKTPFFFR